jgi:carbonic anhydrase
MKRVQALLEGNELFRKGYFKKYESQLLDLVENGQSPKALFIGCADSRVLPDLITSSPPGSLFVLRNVGNFVAPYKPDEDFHAMASGIEYAVNALEVSEIIVCGHTHCGAIAALYSDKGLDETKFAHTRKWLSLGNAAKAMASLALGSDAEPKALQELTERLSVVSQIENLLTYPYVKERVEAGALHLHGWLYDVETGEIEYYDPDLCQYQRLKDLRAAERSG